MYIYKAKIFVFYCLNIGNLHKFSLLYIFLYNFKCLESKMKDLNLNIVIKHSLIYETHRSLSILNVLKFFTT